MKKFIILSQARSGSTLLNESIMQHPDLNVFGEIFNYHRGSSLFADKEGSNILPHKELKRLCSRENCIKAHNEYDGFKLLLCHVHNDVKSYLKESLIILLRRKNLLARYVSHFVAQNTGIWVAEEHYQGSVRINPKNATNDILKTIAAYDKYKDLSSLDLYYEDSIFENVNKVCDLLEIERFTPIITSIKRVNRPLEDIIINYDEVKHLDHTSHF